ARGKDAWQAWRNSEHWQNWSQSRSPAVTARRRSLVMLGDKQAVRILFEKVAPRFTERNGGYTRIVRLAKPRVGDSGTRAMLEFVGKNDRVSKKATKPSFE
ncbi:MAG: bL17 family ribosomal protein, partial [Planctomycetota bacterium]